LQLDQGEYFDRSYFDRLYFDHNSSASRYFSLVSTVAVDVYILCATRARHNTSGVA